MGPTLPTLSTFQNATLVPALQNNCGKIRAVVNLRLLLEAAFTSVAKRRTMIESEKSPEFDESQSTNISQEEVRDVHAEMVRMHQAAAGTIHAQAVDLQQSAVGNVEATRVSTHQSALANVETTEVLAEQSALGYVEAEKASISGYTGVVVARGADIRNAMAVVVVGQDVQVTEARTVLLIGKNVQGNVTTLMDTRDALIAGLVAGLFSGIMLLLGRMLFGRK